MEKLENAFLFQTILYKQFYTRDSSNSKIQQEAQLSPRDRAMRRCQLKSCQLPRNSAETTYTTSSDQIDGMKLEI